MTSDQSASRFRMPAEWDPHESTWLSWPHNLDTWPEHLESVESTMAQAVRFLLEGEHVEVNVLDSTHAERVRELIGAVDHLPYSVRYHLIPTNDAWCRDHGAIFVTDHGNASTRLATLWRYNAWGQKYPPYDLDARVAERMADMVGVPSVKVDMILEGGSIEVNGEGCLMTTASCLLNENRNPGATRHDIEAALRRYLGAAEIIWLGGELVGDDTDGHIDNLARFVDRRTIVIASEDDPDDENYAGLSENADRLRRHRFTDGSQPNILKMPMPQPVFFGADRLPASYCNFYIGNRVVLLPTYGCAEDHRAAAILQACFPDRRVEGLNCRDVVRGLGAFHCLTQQVPG